MSSATNHHELRQRFEAECRRTAPAFLSKQATRTATNPTAQTCDAQALEHVISVMSRLAEDVSQLMDSSSHVSVEALRPAIRRIVEQRGYLAECGDLRDAQDYEDHVNLYVGIVVRVIKQMRTHNRFGGQWADQPVTPMMFG